MKTILCVLMCLLLVGLESTASNKKSSDPAIKKEDVVDSNQVWTFTHYEFGLLRESQKDEFAKMLSNESKSNPILNGVIDGQTEHTVKNTLLSASKWDLVEFKINKACKDKKNYKACEKLASLRHAVLEKYRAHK